MQVSRYYHDSEGRCFSNYLTVFTLAFFDLDMTILLKSGYLLLSSIPDNLEAWQETCSYRNVVFRVVARTYFPGL